MAGWLIEENRAPAWKQSWADRTLSAMETPPLPLVALFAVVVFYLYLSSHSSSKEEAEHAGFGLRLFLVIIPVAVAVFFAANLAEESRFRFQSSAPEQADGDKISPWGVAAMLVVVLALVSYHPSLKSKWFGTV